MTMLTSHSMAISAVLLNGSLKILGVLVVGLSAAALLRHRSGGAATASIWIVCAVVGLGTVLLAALFPGCHHTTAFLVGGGGPSHDLWSVVTHLWATGLFASAAVFVWRQVSLSRAFRAASEPPEWLTDLSEREAAAMGCRRPARIRLSDDAGVACTWGLVNPRILLPAECLGWPRQILSSVLRHEMAHVTRRDWAVALASRFTTALLWFNPAAWSIERRVREALESKADQAVVASGVSEVDYAEHLMWIRARLDGRPSTPGGAVALRPGVAFARRIRTLLGGSRSDSGPSARVAALTVAVAVGAIAISPPWLEARSLPRLGPEIQQETGATILVTNRADASVSLIDARTFEVVAELPVGDGPHEVALDRARGLAYVASYDQGDAVEDSVSVSVVDVPNRLVVRNLYVPGRRALHGIVLSADGSRLWLSAENEQEVLELDTETGEVLARFHTGGQWTHVVEAARDGTILYAADMARGEVAFIDRETAGVRVVHSGDGAEGLDLSPDGSELWVANRAENTVSVLDAETGERIATIPVQGDFPVKLRFAPDGSEVWVTNNRSNALAVISATTRSLLRLVDLPTQPLGIGFSSDASTVLVSAPRLDQLLVLDRASGRLLERIEVGGSPDGIAWLEH